MADISDRCWWAAKSASDVGCALTLIKKELDSSYTADISNIIDELLQDESRLRDISDFLRMYQGREQLVAEYLGLVLSSFTKTLEKILYYLGGKEDFQRIWMKICTVMSNEGRGSLHTRLIMYKTFFSHVGRLIYKPAKFEPVVLQSSIGKILDLRELQGLPRLPALPPIPHPSQVLIVQFDSLHWAQGIFDQKHSRTKLKSPDTSKCYGLPTPDAAFSIPPCSTILFRLRFSDNALSLICYLSPYVPDAARFLIRWTSNDGSPLYSSRGLHELRISRTGKSGSPGSSLVLDEYDDGTREVRRWARLGFRVWEKLVLFHDVFVVLKKLCPETVWCSPEDLRLEGERRLHNCRIIDNKYNHVLSLLSDRQSHGIRLAATIWDGPFKRGPAWTAFLQPEDIKPSFIRAIDSRTIHLRRLDVLVTGDGYNPSKQTTKDGRWKIEFVEKDGAKHFIRAWNALADELR